MRHGITAIALALAVAAPWQALGEPSGEPDRLATIRGIYLQHRDALRAGVLRSHIKKLEALERSFTGAGNPEDLKAVKRALVERGRELAALTATVGGANSTPASATPPAATGARTVTLTPGTANLAGSLNRTSTAIYGWKSPTCIASWSRRGLPPGRYEVHLDFRPIYNGGGQIEVRDLHQTAIVNIPGYRRGGSNPTTVKAATFDLRASFDLKIIPKGRNSAGLFWLSKIRLIPVTNP